MNHPNAELLELLACPDCKGGLVYSADTNSFVCHICCCVFPVCDGIPVMLAGKALKVNPYGESVS